MRFAWVGIVAVAGSCSQTPAPTSTPGPSAEAAREQRFATELDVYFRDKFPAAEPGGAVLVAKRGRTVFARSYGLADMTTKLPVTTGTLFNLGSISKTFVANAILILQERGKLSVKDDLLKYFPGFKDKQIASRVKVEHLLTHTSGLPDNREVDKNPTFYLTAKDAENWQPVTQTDSLVFEPGSRFAYSNPAYNGLALIVEQVSGVKWQTFIRDTIFLPSGMKTSTITDGPHPESGVAHGYVFENGQWNEADYGEEPTFPASGNGGVWSSVEELALYERALHGAVFLSAAAIADSRTVKTFANWTAADPPRLGWSWFIEDKEGVRAVGHTGSQGGFTSNYATIPGKDILIVILTSSPRDIKVFTSDIVQRLQQATWLD